MAIFISTETEGPGKGEHQHIYGVVQANGNSSGKDFTVTKRGTGHYTVFFNTRFEGQPGVTCSLYTNRQAPYVGANIIHVIVSDSESFTCTTMKGDELWDSDFTFIAFGEAQWGR